MPIRFVRMVKFKFLSHPPVDHLGNPVVSSLVLLLCQFAAFAYYVIMVSSLSPHSLHLLFVASYQFSLCIIIIIISVKVLLFVQLLLFYSTLLLGSSSH